MKGPLCVIVISTFFVTTNEQCPHNVESFSVTSCEGSTKYGPYIFIDFHKINRSCACIVSPSFVGALLVKLNSINVQECFTQVKVQNSNLFVCPSSTIVQRTFNVSINQTVEVRAEYSLAYKTGTFYQCIGLQQNGGIDGNLSVICGSPSDAATTTVSSTLTSTQLSHASSLVASSMEKDDPEMLYIIAGSAGGGAIILVGLIVLILVLMNRTRSGGNKKGSTEADIALTNEVFDRNPELPDNPLYLSSQPLDELGYCSDQEKQLGLPPTDSKTKKKINNNDFPPNNIPIDNSASSMPVYAVPKRSKDCTPKVSTGDVYAEVCKPNRSTAQVPVRKHIEDGLLYMEVKQDTSATKHHKTATTNTNDKIEITEGVCYAEIKRT